MEKSELRRIYTQKRNALTNDSLAQYNHLIYENISKVSFASIKTLHSFVPIISKNEVDALSIAQKLQSTYHFRIVTSKTDLQSKEMTHYVLNKDTLFQTNQYDIREPYSGEQITTKDIDAILVPLLAFDEKGYRVGYGKGIYDHFIAQCRDDVVCIGLSFFEPIPQIKDISTWDAKMQLCISPNSVYYF